MMKGIAPQPMIEVLDKFGAAMGVARQLRDTLKMRFGLTDYQIDTMSEARRMPKSFRTHARRLRA